MFSWRKSLWGASTLVLLLITTIVANGAEAGRDKIGLVLAGGGARGIAHVGVIRALEELQIPVDAIAGTSMGALVGGLYATGMSAGDLQKVVSQMDWELAFTDTIERRNQPMHRKADDYDYPIKINLAVKNGELSFPLGLIQGQQVRMIIKDLMVDVDHLEDFDQLPIPYRAVATDIETGEAYIFSQGDIVTAMRASMSIPGLLAPVEHDGRLLVDGGMANNVPVDIARQMGMNRLITIDIGTPLKSRDDIQSLVSVADQMLGFLTRKNSLEQIDTLNEEDFLIRPDLGAVGMLDFADEQTIVENGYQAAMAMREQLSVLSLNDIAWDEYLAARYLPSPGNPHIEYVEISNDSKISDEIVRVRISQALGEPLDRDRLRADIESIYALDYFEIVDFKVVSRDGRSGLKITATEKAWGSDDIKFGLNLVTDLEGGSEFNIGGSYRQKGLNSRGGEFYGRAQLGDTILLSGVFYQPVDIMSRFFIAPRLAYQDYEVLTLGPEFDFEETFGSWRVRDLQFELNAGINAFDNSEFLIGLFRSRGESELELSRDNVLTEGSFDKGGAVASWRYDNMDNIFFPRNGGFLYAEYERNSKDLGSDENFDRWHMLAQGAHSFGDTDRNTIIFTAKTSQSVDAANEPENYYQLGGLFNLSGLPQNALSGRQTLFAMAQYQRKLSANSVIPLNMPVYAGFSAEAGQLWSDRSDVDFGDLKGAGSVYLAIDSPLGPLYFAYGRAADSRNAIYLSLGWPFLNQNSRVGR
ncbi:MAG: patatin-like phospholipase family protein [Halioglobus sp.]